MPDPGRPTLYKLEHASRARALCARGATNPDLLEPAPWVRQQNEGRKGRKGRKPPAKTLLEKLSAFSLPHFWAPLHPPIGHSLAEIAGIAGIGRLPADPKQWRQASGDQRFGHQRFSSNSFKDLASPAQSSSGAPPGVIGLSHLRNRTVTCGS